MNSGCPRSGLTRLCACAVLTSALCVPAWGTIVNYTLDPAQSSLTLSNTWLGMNMVQQSSGSLVTSYDGFIQADVTDTSIQFLSATLDARANGSFKPAVDGARGNDPADYGGRFPLGWFSVLGAVNIAVRDVALGLASAPVALDAGAFDASAAALTATGSVDHAGIGLLGWLAGRGRAPLGGSASNEVDVSGSLVRSGNVETLTLPVDVTYALKIASPFLPSQLEWFEVNLSGTIVATRTRGDEAERPLPDDPTIPEPATLVLLAIGCGVLGSRRR